MSIALVTMIVWLALGESFGFAIGISAGAFIETKFINFSVEGTFRQKALRFAIGLVFIILVYILPKLLLPANNLVAFCRYFIIPIAAMDIWPDSGGVLSL